MVGRLQLNKRRVSVILTPKIHRAFVARCRKNKVYCQGAFRMLATLYAADKIHPIETELPKKPYKNWFDFKSDDLLWAKVNGRANRDGEQVAAVLRGLIAAYVEGTIDTRLADLVDTAEIVQPGRGGRSWKERIFPRPVRKRYPPKKAAP